MSTPSRPVIEDACTDYRADGPCEPDDSIVYNQYAPCIYCGRYVYAVEEEEHRHCSVCGHRLEQPRNDPPLPCKNCISEFRAGEED